MKKVYIEVSGGCVVGVYAPPQMLSEAVIVDHDNIKRGDPDDCFQELLKMQKEGKVKEVL